MRSLWFSETTASRNNVKQNRSMHNSLECKFYTGAIRNFEHWHLQINGMYYLVLITESSRNCLTSILSFQNIFCTNFVHAAILIYTFYIYVRIPIGQQLCENWVNGIFGIWIWTKVLNLADRARQLFFDVCLFLRFQRSNILVISISLDQIDNGGLEWNCQFNQLSSIFFQRSLSKYFQIY